MKWTPFFIALVFYLGFADVVPPGDIHWCDKEVFVTNSTSFPQYKVIGFIRSVSGHDSAYVIQDSVELFKGYKFNGFSLYAIRKSLLDSCGGVNGLNFQAISEHLSGASIVDPNGGYLSNSVPMIKDTYYYQIESLNSITLILKLVKRIKHYSDGRSDEIEEY
jgi:hypothetical protein